LEIIAGLADWKKFGNAFAGNIVEQKVKNEKAAFEAFEPEIWMILTFH